MSDRQHVVFFPNGEDTQETALLLTGTADQFGISQSAIRTVPGQGGFMITEELADALDAEDDPQNDPDSDENKEA